MSEEKRAGEMVEGGGFGPMRAARAEVYEQMLSRLRILDPVFTWRRSSHAEDVEDLVVSEGIEGITGGPSHVQWYFGKLLPPYHVDRTWEFTEPGCRWGSIFKIDPLRTDIEIGRHILMPNVPGKNFLAPIVEEARRLIGKSYDESEFLFQLLHELGIELPDWTAQDEHQCSTGGNHLYAIAGLVWCPGHGPWVSPEDIRRSVYYKPIWRWGNASGPPIGGV